MLSFLARVFLLRRLFGSDDRGGAYGGRRGSRYGGHRRRSGFGMTGPFPTYSRRTRGGGRVSVGGCCLPIPLALTLGALSIGRTIARRP